MFRKTSVLAVLEFESNHFVPLHYFSLVMMMMSCTVVYTDRYDEHSDGQKLTKKLLTKSLSTF